MFKFFALVAWVGMVIVGISAILLILKVRSWGVFFQLFSV
jgi:hypothetical protein